ncbi:GNAT family N-acetyltransferase [Actinoplanes sp. NPDC051346]|uniref:GNAT family N-acetyltransferase n=1 Tax=Actinoplanes sp. NPDC051346 TaxID=3155048 RepID=UPI00342871DA
MQIAEERTLEPDEAFGLYDAVGWYGYTKDVGKLVRSLAGSHLVLTVRNADGRLVGLARTVSDGETVCYLQDLLVHPDAQRSGIGRALVEELKRRYEHCRFFLLSTDAAESPEAEISHPFYRALGFVAHEDQGMAAFGLPVKR